VPDVIPDYNNKTADIDFTVTEKGGSQIELQGGYGGGAFIGTLGLSFNNFAIRNLFNKEAYKPLPTGDGQKLALRLQSSRFFQTYSFSFSEPWLGGKKPVQFSVSLSHSKQFQYNFLTRRADKSQSFNITGVTVGLAKRLTVPDDYFTIPLGKAAMIKEGEDVTIISYGAGVHWALSCLNETNISADLIDLRTLQPLDEACIYNSVKKTGRVIILQEDSEFGGIASDISALISENCFEYLDAAVIRVASPAIPIPFAKNLESIYLPNERFKQALMELLAY